MPEGVPINDAIDESARPGFAERLGRRLLRIRSRFDTRGRAVAFGVAAALVGITLRVLLNDPGARFVVLYPTVALSALIAGPIAGLTTTVLATLAAEALYFRFLRDGGVAGATDILVFANFVFTGAMISLVAAVDRSSSRRREREGHAADIRHRTVVDALHDGVIVFGLDGAVLDYNPAAERILGHPAGSLSHYPPGFVGWALFHEDGTRMSIAEYPAVRAAATGVAIEGELIGIPRGDGLAWLLNNAAPIVDPQTGAVTAVVVSFADVTERRRVETELAENRRHLSSVLDALHEAVLVFDPTGRTVSANRSAEKVLRRPVSDLLGGEGFLGLGRPAIRADGSPFPVEERPIRRALATGRGSRDTLVGIVDPSGTFWLRVNEAPIHDPKTGALSAVVASFSDVTEWRDREVQLAASRADLASIFAAVHEGILVIGRDGRFLSWNPAAERLLRRTPEQLRAANIYTAAGGLREDGSPMAPGDYPAVRTLRTGETMDNVLLGVPFPSGTLWLLVNSEPIRDAETGEVRAAVVSLYDVTERYRTRQELEESRARFASIVASAMDAIVSVDETRRIVLFNAAAERTFGLGAAEAIGRPLRDFVPERLHQRHDAAFERYLRAGQATHVLGDGRPVAAQRADGTEFLVEGSVSRVEIDGRPLYTLILRDVTARLAAERVDAQLATVVRHSPDAVLTVSMEGRFETWNDAATRMFGYTEEEAVGAPIDIIFFSDAPHGVETFERIRRGEPIRIEAVRRRADGTAIEVMTSAAPIRDGAGQITGTVAIITDISERKKKERQLAERDEELRQTLDAAGLGLWWCDVATGIVHADPRSRRLFDVADAETLAAVTTRFHPDDRALFRDIRGRLGRADGAATMVLRRPDAEGTLTWLSLTARLRRRAGGEEEIWGTVQDVTETRRAEEALRRFEASRRLEALGRMTGGIAHDLNNLLTVVSGNLQLLEMSPTSANAGRWIAEALRASESGAALNERLLTFARRRRLEPTLTNLNDLVGSMVDMLHRSIGPSITVTTVLGADLGEVRIDPAEIENAILNLVLNARDAMPTGGRIVIETANADLDRDGLPPEEGIRPGEFVRLCVTDSGQGMSQEVKARAFEPFFTTKDVGRGSGLGLSTLHGFVRQSGGFVTLYSEVGHGTTVNVFLPRVASAGERPSLTRRRTPVRGDGQTILVVEDDADVRRVDREQLEALGYRVVTAANAADAMAALAAADRPIDLVFTDVIMPGGVSGLDLARRLVAADPARRVLLTSGFAGDFIAGGNTAETEFPFLRKPHSLAELADAVADALRPPA